MMTGEAIPIEHPLGIAVSPSMDEAKLAELGCERTDLGTGWVWYRLPSFEDGQVTVAIALGFNEGALRQVSISDSSTRFGSGWGTWSEQGETLRAESIANWLVAKGLAPGTYRWGSVWAGYDSKGGLGSALIRFAT